MDEKCVCQTASWFVNDKSWIYTLECPIHHHKDIQSVGIVPVECSTLTNEEEKHVGS